MALARINLVLQDDDGDVIDGASIEVRNEATLALAPVFSDRAGASSLGNPYTAADGADAGFYVAGGSYKITATSGAFSKIIRYQTAIDYEQGTWTPAIAAFTSGNLTIVYGTQVGTYTKIGRMIACQFSIATSTFTHTTASGQITITGLPFTPNDDYVGTLVFAGITKANYTQFAPVTADGLTAMAIEASGSGQSLSNLQIADTPSGGDFLLRGMVTFWEA